jgi:uncharacterized protein involved in type VI secretion and phage assembly
MLSAQITNAHFTVAGQKLPVAHFSLIEAISTPVELTLSLSPSYALDLTSYIGQSTQFSLESFCGAKRTWHLVCEGRNLGLSKPVASTLSRKTHSKGFLSDSLD